MPIPKLHLNDLCSGPLDDPAYNVLNKLEYFYFPYDITGGRLEATFDHNNYILNQSENATLQFLYFVRKYWTKVITKA